jgi:hypothetical protein
MGTAWYIVSSIWYNACVDSRGGGSRSWGKAGHIFPSLEGLDALLRRGVSGAQSIADASNSTPVPVVFMLVPGIQIVVTRNHSHRPNSLHEGTQPFAASA